MPIPRYYRLSVSTGTNCPHDNMLSGIQQDMQHTTVNDVSVKLCVGLRTMEASHTVGVGTNALVNAGMDIGEGAVVAIFSRGRLGNVRPNGGKCILWSGGKYQKCEVLGEWTDYCQETCTDRMH
jgi:hypothetical protein